MKIPLVHWQAFTITAENVYRGTHALCHREMANERVEKLMIQKHWCYELVPTVKQACDA